MDFLSDFFSGKPMAPKVVEPTASQQRWSDEPEAPKKEQRRAQKKYATEFVAKFKDEVWKVRTPCMTYSFVQKIERWESD